ncbi:MAG: 50S ribosomal protein L11 methyltransferase [Pseudomonadota bacterium]
MAIISQLDALTVDGEPILSAYRAEQDGPWTIDILFADTEADAQTRWLEAAAELCPELPALKFDALAERDWVAETQRALHPVRAGRFTVHGSHDSARLPPSRFRIMIDAGRAFGTAHHASTKGCLVALERAALVEPLGEVLDVGTGTGVLAIAAEKLGATAVRASDIDPVAVRVASQNVRANRVSRPIRVDTMAGPKGSADTVTANILARPLIAMAPALAASTRRRLILSGLRTRDRRRVEAAYVSRGFVVLSRIVIDDWITIALGRFRAPQPPLRA